MPTRYLPTDQYRAMQAKLADARPTLNQPDLKTVIAEILGEFGIWPDYCRDDAEHRYLRRRNFV